MDLSSRKEEAWLQRRCESPEAGRKERGRRSKTTYRQPPRGIKHKEILTYKLLYCCTGRAGTLLHLYTSQRGHQRRERLDLDKTVSGLSRREEKRGAEKERRDHHVCSFWNFGWIRPCTRVVELSGGRIPILFSLSVCSW